MSSIKPLAIEALLSRRTLGLKRLIASLLLRRRNTVTFYHEIFDPHSHVLLCALYHLFSPAYPHVRFDVRIVDSRALIGYASDDGADRRWKSKDAGFVANVYGLEAEFTDEMAKHAREPVNDDEALRAASNALDVLSSSSHASRDDLRKLIDIGSTYFSSSTSLEPLDDAQAATVRAKIDAATNAFSSYHYLGGVLVYGFEQYWGVDRLGYLEAQFSNSSTDCGPIFTKTHQYTFPRNSPPLVDDASSKTAFTLELYFSFRSPYSNIVLDRVKDLVHHYRDVVKLVVKPVLPMVMRGLAVPSAKKMYIVYDAAREARTVKCPFGRISDPVGRPTLRAFRAFYAMETELKTSEADKLKFLKAWSVGIWGTKGYDANSDGGFKRILRDASCFSDAQIARLMEVVNVEDVSDDESEAYYGLAKRNRARMGDEMDLWGVPSLRLVDDEKQEVVCDVWGQDRLFVVDAALRSRV